MLLRIESLMNTLQLVPCEKKTDSTHVTLVVAKYYRPFSHLAIHQVVSSDINFHHKTEVSFVEVEIILKEKRRRAIVSDCQRRCIRATNRLLFWIRAAIDRSSHSLEARVKERKKKKKVGKRMPSFRNNNDSSRIEVIHVQSQFLSN